MATNVKRKGKPTKAELEALPSTTSLKVSPDHSESSYGTILQCIANPPEGSVVLEITPHDAQRILTNHNQNNRPFKAAGIADYQRDMEMDNWAVTGDTIKFAPNGRLLDGQNRMEACSTSGKSFRTHVVFGIDESCFARIDIGRVRSAGDILAIKGYHNVNILASAVRWSLLLDNDPNRVRHYRPEEILLAIGTDYKDIEDYLVHGRALYSSLRVPPGESAALLRQFFHRDEDTADAFYRAWRFGYTDGRADVLRKMMDFMAQMKARQRGGIPGRVRVALVITAWNEFRANRKGSYKVFQDAAGRRIPPIA